MSTPFALTREGPERLRASGRIDVDNAGSALAAGRQEIGSDNQSSIDLRGLESADSVTLAVLLAWAAPVSARGGRLTFLGAPARLQALAELSDVDRMLGSDTGIATAPA